VAVYIGANGQLGTLSSSARFKKDIRDMAGYSRGLLDLRPVTFHYKEPAGDGARPLESGLIAEEVAKVYPDLVTYDRDGQLETVQYHKLTPMLLNELQRQQNTLDAQAEQLNAQTQQIAEVNAQNQALQAALTELKTELQARLGALTADRQSDGENAQSRDRDKIAGVIVALCGDPPKFTLGHRDSSLRMRMNLRPSIEKQHQVRSYQRLAAP